MRPTQRAAWLLACMLAVSCVHYSSIQSADGKIYLSGAKSFWFISIPFLKRCDLDGTTLHCEELEEYKPEPDKGGAPGANQDDGAAEADSEGGDEADGDQEAGAEKDDNKEEDATKDESKPAKKP